MDSYIVFTVCNYAYLPRARVLARSLMQHSGVRLKIVLFENKSADAIELPCCDLIWVEDLEVPDWRRLAFRYDIIEFSTSLKPWIALRLLKTAERVIFLDPDTCLFGSVDPVLQDLDQHWIVLTPHYTTPQPPDPGESDLGMMKFGSFNLGFFAVKGCDATQAFLSWWSRRCIDFAFMEAQFGLSTDQKWVTIAPCLFPGMFTSFNLGYNVAPWNSFERRIEFLPDGTGVVNKTYPLVFFHFSNFDAGDPEYLKKRASSERGERRPDLKRLGEQYSEELRRMHLPLAERPYSFDYFSDGSYISPALRRAFNAVEHELALTEDPFEAEGVVGKFARQNFLLQKGNAVYRRQGYADAQRNGRILGLLIAMMKIVLRVVGPNRFHNLCRLMVYLSSTRQLKQMWKLESR